MISNSKKRVSPEDSLSRVGLKDSFETHNQPPPPPQPSEPLKEKSFWQNLFRSSGKVVSRPPPGPSSSRFAHLKKKDNLNNNKISDNNVKINTNPGIKIKNTRNSIKNNDDKNSVPSSAAESSISSSSSGSSSSSRESLNTIMTSKSFSFDQRPKRKSKGKRLPIENSPVPQKNRKKMNTLTRLRLKIGLKAKYNLQSCESLDKYSSSLEKIPDIIKAEQIQSQFKIQNENQTKKENLNSIYDNLPMINNNNNDNSDEPVPSTSRAAAEAIQLELYNKEPGQLGLGHRRVISEDTQNNSVNNLINSNTIGRGLHIKGKRKAPSPPSTTTSLKFDKSKKYLPPPPPPKPLPTAPVLVLRKNMEKRIQKTEYPSWKNPFEEIDENDNSKTPPPTAPTPVNKIPVASTSSSLNTNANPVNIIKRKTVPQTPPTPTNSSKKDYPAWKNPFESDYTDENANENRNKKVPATSATAFRDVRRKNNRERVELKLKRRSFGEFRSTEPENEPQQQSSPVSPVVRNDELQNTNTTTTTITPIISTIPAVEIEGLDDETAQNIINDLQEREESIRASYYSNSNSNSVQNSENPVPGTSSSSTIEIPSSSSSNSHHQTDSSQVLVLNEKFRDKLKQLKDEADKSPFRDTVPRKKDKNPPASNENTENSPATTITTTPSFLTQNPPLSPSYSPLEFNYPYLSSPGISSNNDNNTALSPVSVKPVSKPWYKRNPTGGKFSSSSQNNATNPPATSSSSSSTGVIKGNYNYLTKLSDIDREAGRIVEENRRKNSKEILETNADSVEDFEDTNAIPPPSSLISSNSNPDTEIKKVEIPSSSTIPENSSSAGQSSSASSENPSKIVLTSISVTKKDSSNNSKKLEISPVVVAKNSIVSTSAGENKFQKYEEWICGRCTLKNPHWRFLCEACYFRKQEPPFRDPAGVKAILLKAAGENEKTKNPTYSPAEIKNEKMTTTTTTESPGIEKSKVIKYIPPCENFLGQIPTKKELPGKEEKIFGGVKLTSDPEIEELDIKKLRQARVEFFTKNQLSPISAKSPVGQDSCSSPETPEIEQNNILLIESNNFYENQDFGAGGEGGCPNFDHLNLDLEELSGNNLGENRTWSKSLGRFRPILEAITESNYNDPFYNCRQRQQLQEPRIYENCQSNLIDDGTNYNYFMQQIINQNQNNNNANNILINDETGNNNNMDRKMSSSSSNNSRRMMNYEDYRKLGAVPKYFNNSSSSSSIGENHPPASSSSMSMSMKTVSVENNNNSGEITTAARKLVKKLEKAISQGDFRIAASLAQNLAMMKVNCIVALNTQPIGIRVYVEDRFMQQGPFHVQVTHSMTVKELKEKIESDWGIPKTFQKWILGKKLAEKDEEPLSEFDLINDSMAFLYLITPQIESIASPSSSLINGVKNISKKSGAAAPPEHGEKLKLKYPSYSSSESTPSPPIKLKEEKEKIKIPPPLASSSSSQIPENLNSKKKQSMSENEKEKEKLVKVEPIIQEIQRPPRTKKHEYEKLINVQKLIIPQQEPKEIEKEMEKPPEIPPKEISKIVNSNTQKLLIKTNTNEQDSKLKKPLPDLPKNEENTINKMAINGKIINNITPPLAAKKDENNKPETSSDLNPKPYFIKNLPSKKQIEKIDQGTEMDKMPKNENKPKVPEISESVNANNYQNVQLPLTIEKFESDPERKINNTDLEAPQNIEESLPPPPPLPPKAVSPTATAKSPVSQLQEKSLKLRKDEEIILVEKPKMPLPEEPKDEKESSNLIKKEEKIEKISQISQVTRKTVPKAGVEKVSQETQVEKNEKNIPKLSHPSPILQLPTLTQNKSPPLSPPSPNQSPSDTKLENNNIELINKKDEVLIIGERDNSPSSSSNNNNYNNLSEIINDSSSLIELDNHPQKTQLNQSQISQIPIINQVEEQKTIVQKIQPPSSSENLDVVVQNQENTKIPEEENPGKNLVKPVEILEDQLENVEMPEENLENPVEHLEKPGEGDPIKNVEKPGENLPSTSSAKVNGVNGNENDILNELEMMEKQDLIENLEPFKCPICFDSKGSKEGVVLRDCLHNFCRECLIGSIKYAEEPQVKCPFRDDKYSCQSNLQEREIKAIVPTEMFEKYLARSVKLAESKILNTFHCKTNDCTGWCVYEPEVNIFNCPVCKKRNCLTCQAIHEGKDCQKYQRELAIAAETDEDAKSSRIMLEEMIKKGEGLPCPACNVVLIKKWGCDYVRCSYCKTEICWVTKGFRWGPGGKGDTSGGCKCGINGIRCHPKCTYCH